MNLDAVIQLHRTGDLVGAESGYRALMARRLRDADLYSNLALICLNSGRLEEAITHLYGALKINPNNPETHLNLGVALQQKGSLEAAISSFHQALKLNPNYPEAYNNLGIVSYSQGKWDAAITAYKMAVSLKPDFAEAHYNLGNAHKVSGQNGEAIACYERAIEAKPDYLPAYLNLGNALQDEGRWDEAVAAYRKALEVHPKFADAYNNMGNALKGKGDYTGAIECFQQACDLDAKHIFARVNLAMIRNEQGRIDEAVSCYRDALAINPNLAQAHFSLAAIFSQQGKSDEAIASYRKAIAADPRHPEANNNLAVLLADRGDLQGAVSCYRRAIAAKPDFAEAHYNLGNALRALGQRDGAVGAYQTAISVRPDYAQAYLNLGNVYQELRRWNEAVTAYSKVLELYPDFPEGHNNLGTALVELGAFNDAIECYRKAIELRPGYGQAHYNTGIALQHLGKWHVATDSFIKEIEATVDQCKLSSDAEKLAKLLLETERIPIVYEDSAQLEQARQHLGNCLRGAAELAEQKKGTFNREETGLFRHIILRLNNFYLVYQQLNDLEIQTAYSQLVLSLLGDEMRPYLIVEKQAAPAGKIRLGIASEHLRKHNGASWAYGWLSNLPRDDYEFFFYFLNPADADDLTEKFASLGAFRVMQFREHNYLQALEAIKQDKLDILLLPDVGMTASSKIISLARLAPVQCVGWGHPVTTGSPNIDYFLSGELMEAPEAQSHYTEKLVRLPKIGVHLDYPVLPPAGNQVQFLEAVLKERTVFGAVQSLFKYLPEFDRVYPAIAKAVPDALFIFASSTAQEVTDVFSNRLQRSFEKAGVSFERHVKILQRMPLSDFMQLLSRLDVYLDSIGFSGGITAARALAVNCPMVTMPGEFMRGRLGYGMLKMIGADELIAETVDDYISLAIELGRSKERRAALSEQIKASKHKLFNDFACVKYLDNFFKEKVSEIARG